MSNPSKQSLNNTNPVPNQNFAMMPSQMPPLNSVDRMQELQDYSIGLSNPSFQVQYGAPANMFLYQDNQFSSRGSVYVKEEKDDGCSSGLHTNTSESGASPKTFVAYSPGSDHEKSDKLGAFADLVLGLDKGSSPLSVAAISGVQEGNHPSPVNSSTNHQAVLRYQTSRDAMLSAINYSDSVILQEGPFDVNVSQLSSLDEGLMGNLGVTNAGTSSASAFDLFDGDTGQDSYMETNQDLQLSPQTFSNNPDAFNENSNLSSINDTTADNIDKSRIKKPVKATSPNRQGVQACFQCGKVFSNSSALAKHKLTHSDERKYVCQLCSKAFKRQDHLNGHMLTHRKKKPYECKVEGCGKSYCDARSLRRHTENHHSSTASTCISVPVSGVTVIPTTGIRGPITLGAMSPFSDNKLDTGSSFVTKVPIPNRIQYAPPPPSSYNASNAVHNVATSSSDATSTTAAEQLQILAFQQPVNNLLSWQNQQQQQTQQQQPYLNQQVFQDSSSHSPQSDGFMLPQASTASNASCSPIHTSRSQHTDANMMSINERQILRMTLSQVDEQNSHMTQNQTGAVQTTNQLLPTELMMSSHQQLQQLQNLPISLSQQNQLASQSQQRQWIGHLPFQVTQSSNFTQEPKPAECPLCHRKFKNVPALNGHMRLHGGYFKRDNDPNKKTEKKAETGHNPPLQTASMNVRALIEEKIIQKRIVNPQVYTQPLGNYSDVSSQQFQMIPPLDDSAGTDSIPLDSLNEGLPMDLQEDLMTIRQGLLSQPPIPPEKFRRHSDSDHFLAPRRPPASNVLVDIIRRKVAGKRAQRTGSDPGDIFIPTVTQPQNTASMPHSPSTIQSPLHSPLLQPATTASIPNSPTTPVTAQWSQHSRPMDFMFTSDVESQLPIQIEAPVPPIENSGMQQISLPPQATPTSAASSTLTVPKILLEREDDDDVFLNPSTIPASPMRSKKKHRPEPLFIPPHVNTSISRFPSQLRSPRQWDPNSEVKVGSPPPYTPPPMLSPVRNGSGLFWHILSSGSATPKSAPLTPRFSSTRRSNSTDGFSVEEEISEPPETDVQPHVNVGSQYQAILPVFRENCLDRFSEIEKADLVWNPKVENNLSEEDVEAYLEFACCAAVPGGGRNKEYALMILQLVDGNLQEALLRLMNPSPKLPSGHHLLTYPFTECDTWSAEDIHSYTQALNKCDKDFFSIAQELCNKTVKQCVQFYYLWKKVCPDEYKRHRVVRRKREQENMYGLRFKGVSDVDVDIESQQVSKYDPGSPFSYTGRDSPANSANDKFACEFPDCTATFVSRQALNGHVRIHGRNTTNGPTCSPDRDHLDPVKAYSPINNNSTSNTSSEMQEEFPCKICGKVFPKVKSRSAHMKSHRQEGVDKRTSKYD